MECIGYSFIIRVLLEDCIQQGFIVGMHWIQFYHKNALERDFTLRMLDSTH